MSKNIWQGYAILNYLHLGYPCHIYGIWRHIFSQKDIHVISLVYDKCVKNANGYGFPDGHGAAHKYLHESSFRSLPVTRDLPRPKSLTVAAMGRLEIKVGKEQIPPGEEETPFGEKVHSNKNVLKSWYIIMNNNT